MQRKLVFALLSREIIRPRGITFQYYFGTERALKLTNTRFAFVKQFRIFNISFGMSGSSEKGGSGV